MATDTPDWGRLPNGRIRSLLTDYVHKLHERLPEVVAGVYLYNSIALGAYDEGQSDIDFITLVKRPLDMTEVDVLQAIHRQLEADHEDATSMDGMYIGLEHLGQSNDAMPPYPYYATESFHPAGYWDINNVTWWTLKHHGITLTGVPARQLDFEVPWERVHATMAYNINGYWTRRAQMFVGEVDDEDIADGVLIVCRIFYTLAEQDILPKVRAGEYALQHLDPHWHPIIREALRIRLGGQGASLYDSQADKTEATAQFLNAMIRFCQERYLIERKG